MTEVNGRRIVFPGAMSFYDIFESAEKYTAPSRILLSVPSWEAGTWSDKQRKTRFRVSSYLIMRSESFNIKLRPEVLKWIEAGGMLHVSDDTTYFTINVWDDGKALVTISHGLITGNHYLAVIDAATIPTVGE